MVQSLINPLSEILKKSQKQIQSSSGETKASNLNACATPIYGKVWLRGAVVEWLERLAVVRKVAGSSPARAKRLENSHCPPSREWVPDSLQGSLKAVKGEDWAPPFTCSAQDMMGL